MHVRDKALFNELLRKARRNRYELELLRAVNDFQLTSSNLLLSLKESDTAQKKNKASEDRYFHLWSREEDLSCMIQVEKEYHILVRK